jgi:hypothetical protein
MKIECLCRRPPKGSVVKIHDTEYEFIPDEKGREFCEVTNPEHIAIFQKIPEGYALHGSASKEQPKAAHAPDPTPAAAKGDELDHMGRNDLATLFLSEVGRTPSSALSKAQLIEAIREHRAA